MADKKIKDATLKSVLNGIEELPLNDSGSDKKTTISAIAVYVKSLISNIFNSIILNPSYVPTSTQEGEVWWGGKFHTLNMNTGLYDDVIKLGQDQFFVFYNDTGADIDPFKVMHLKSATSFDGELYPTFEYADPRYWEKVQGTLALSCCTILDGTLGILIRSSPQITGGDTSAIPAGSQLWLAPDGTGSITDQKPSFQDYAFSLGGNYNQVSANGGKIFVSFTSSIDDDFHNAWDGGTRESFSFTTSSNGTIVTGLLENVINTRNLTCFFSDVGRYTIDTTTAPLTIELTPGTDSNEQTNYVYVPKSTKVLTVSTSGWPALEHCRIAELEIQSASTTQDDGGTLGNQNTNDHIKKEDDNGHILHIAAWIRKQFATWESGTESTFDNTGGNGYVQITGGIANQLHEQSLASFSMSGGDEIRVWNDFSGSRPKISNLTSVTTYSDGSSWNNDWGKIVVWRGVNKGGEYAPVMFNLPSNGYNSEVNALADLGNYADYSIPNSLKTKAILIGAFTFRISGGTITYSGGYEDLRGQIPIVVAGGGGGGGGGVTTYLALTDTPNSRVGKAGNTIVVNVGETADEYEPKGWMWNAAISFYTNVVSLATQAREVFLPDRDGTILLEGDEAAYKFSYQSLILPDPSPPLLPNAGFLFNDVNGDGKIDDSTILYLSSSHLPAAYTNTATNNFVADLKAGASITLAAFPNATDGNGGRCEVKLTGDVTSGTNIYILPITVITGMDEPTVDSEYWLGFHQGAFELEMINEAAYVQEYKNDKLDVSGERAFACDVPDVKAATEIWISNAFYGVNGETTLGFFIEELSIGTYIEMQTSIGTNLHYKTTGEGVHQGNGVYVYPITLIHPTGGAPWIPDEDTLFWMSFYPPSSGGGGGNVSRERQTLTVTTNNIDLDWDGSNDLISSNRVAVSAGVTITYLNSTSAEFSTFKVEITNSATLTFPSGTVSGDANWSSLVWTPPSNGKFTVSIYKTGTEYEVILTQSAAV
jgi:hypothetical protein